MKIITDFQKFPFIDSGTLTIGFFDGFHLGHRKIISLVLEKAKKFNTKTIVFTFSNHPLEIISPDKKIELITINEDKINFLKKAGIDYLIMPEFTEEFRHISATNFLNNLKNNFNFLDLIIGENFKFGDGNKGNIKTISNFSENDSNFILNSVPPVKLNNIKISSTIIRKLLKKGEMKEANILLNRNFYIKNIIIKGDQIGRKIGFPTANINIPFGQIVPRLGVYSGSGTLKGKEYKALIYIGNNKLNCQLKTPQVEAHLIGLDEEVYGEELKVSFYNWIRKPQKICNINELKLQLLKDKKFIESSNL